MIIYIFLLLALLNPRSILAQTPDYRIICPDDPNSTSVSTVTCYKDSGPEPFFSHPSIYPGFISDPANILTIVNQDQDMPCFLTASTTRTSGNELLFTGDHRLNLSVLEGSMLWYSGPIEFSDQTLGQIDPNTSKNLDWYISLPQSAGNDYQNLSSVFDLDLDFVCASTPDWSPTPTVQSAEQPFIINTTSSPGPPTCNDPTPATPVDLVATATGSNVLLTWNAIVEPFTSYLVAYGPSADNILYGNPNIGISTSYTVGGLTPGAQYCFYVRAQNGCMPGSPSNTICVNTGSTVPIAETIPPTGFQPEVLGQQDTSPSIAQGFADIGDIKGVENESCSRYYIPLLFIIALLVNALYLKDEDNTNLFLPSLVSLTAFLIDWFILSKSCCRVHHLYCRYFWIGNILAVLVPRFAFKHRRK